ncbi:MAG TPA: hypothetical protein VI424_21590, partial [Terriglobales bacterium]
AVISGQLKSNCQFRASGAGSFFVSSQRAQKKAQRTLRNAEEIAGFLKYLFDCHPERRLPIRWRIVRRSRRTLSLLAVPIPFQGIPD